MKSSVDAVITGDPAVPALAYKVIPRAVSLNFEPVQYFPANVTMTLHVDLNTIPHRGREVQ